MKTLKELKLCHFFPCFVFVVLLFSCKPTTFEGIDGEGVVEYDILYKKNELQNSIPEAFLPKKMILTFSNRYVKNSIDGYAGIISIRNISDLMMDTVTTAIKFFGHKYFYTSKPKETPCCFEILEKPNITLLDDSMKIAGIMCQKALVEFPAIGKSHSVYYIKDMNVKLINKNTAYSVIPGILMDFEMDMGNLTLNFKASKIQYKKVEDKEFLLDKDYKKKPKDEMVKIIGELLE